MRTETRQIGEHTYEVTMLPLMQWQQLRDAVWPTLMGVIPDIVEGSDKPTPEQFSDVIRSVSILLPLQGDSYRTAMKLLQESSKVEGRPGYIANIAELWWAEAGYAELGEWFAFALEVQLVPFLSGLPLASLNRLAQARRSASQTTSIGRSGGSSAGGMAL